MSSNRKLRSCYLRWAKNAGGISATDIDLSVKLDSFIQELQALQSLTDNNGWLNLRITENASPEGKGDYTHKIRVLA